MATEYSVGVSRNRFELIDMSEDEDPFEILKIREREKEARKKKHEEHSDKENKAKEGSGKKDKVSAKEVQKPKEEIRGRTTGGGGTPGERHDGKNERNTRRYEIERVEESHQTDGVTESRYDRNVSRGDRRLGGGFQDGGEGRIGRGRVFGRGRSGGPRGGERNYEGRRSGGGYQERSFGGGGYQERSSGGGGGGGYPDRFSVGGSGRFEKKEEFISHDNSANFDSDWDITEPVKALTVATETTNENKPNDVEESTEPAALGNEAPTTGQETLDEELRELTLDEWKAMKKREEPTYNIRKAGEGEDLTKWKNMVALKKDKDKENDEEDSDVDYEICEYPQRVGRQKYIKDLNFKFAERRRGGGAPRRGRGRDRRGFSEYESYDGQKVQSKKTAPPPKVDDEHDFPSLG